MILCLLFIFIWTHSSYDSFQSHHIFFVLKFYSDVEIKSECDRFCFAAIVALNAAVLLLAPSRLNENGVGIVVVVFKYCPKLPKLYGFFVVDETRFR